MKITSFAFILLVLCGCSTHLPEPAANRPSQLYFEQVGLPVHKETYELDRRGFLVNRSEFFNGPKKKHIYSPTATQWRNFYSELADISIWDWKSRYLPSDDQDKQVFIEDGFIWKFSITQAGRQISTEGDNAIPSESSPKKTVYEFVDVYEKDFGRLGKLQKALQNLKTSSD